MIISVDTGGSSDGSDGNTVGIRIIAAQALTTMAIRSGEPFKLQIYEFLHTLAQSDLQSQFSDIHLKNGEDQGDSGTGLGVLLSPMIKVLDEMYRAQDDLIKKIRNHDNAKKEWTDDELKKLYETHERLLDLVSLFCYVPRTKVYVLTLGIFIEEQKSKVFL
ncbi:uncharacterized protein [Arachis hypogaea]|uniref:uncharacterized protein isoform X1 n=2 Tax=Arachis hypogaea TaxID=3818 RepID=UPI000DECFE69|nr:uncharacterized protein LOC112710689 isoform X1 [Arachis hypogaea]XP_025618823.1 uncharacterized protein LOC112710689 isoform X1 [Arachis hypogaea]XP_025618824.1 uncharacterized protein LOC112710689 isoform X1 [Arachis hypogaea]XP_025618825.1 uncharacterized protein LOC112710689 isoform X1 [Arachis hypogaea]XP_025618826.1 uncharacterized protein LOC112710689 isoform X1 [Arachis hypogaea]XP_029144780.1 uncharacterized protein LOC112710689 isoform X1 [Arachis hypogaea]